MQVTVVLDRPKSLNTLFIRDLVVLSLIMDGKTLVEYNIYKKTLQIQKAAMLNLFLKESHLQFM